MLIWQIEAALERTRLALVFNDSEEARRKLDETRALIKKTLRRLKSGQLV